MNGLPALRVHRLVYAGPVPLGSACVCAGDAVQPMSQAASWLPLAQAVEAAARTCEYVIVEVHSGQVTDAGT